MIEIKRLKRGHNQAALGGSERGGYSNCSLLNRLGYVAPGAAADNAA